MTAVGLSASGKCVRSAKAQRRNAPRRAFLARSGITPIRQLFLSRMVTEEPWDILEKLLSDVESVAAHRAGRDRPARCATMTHRPATRFTRCDEPWSGSRWCWLLCPGPASSAARMPSPPRGNVTRARSPTRDYSPDGLNDTQHMQGCCCCGGNEITNAVDVNVNVLAYALTH